LVDSYPIRSSAWLDLEAMVDAASRAMIEKPAILRQSPRG